MPMWSGGFIRREWGIVFFNVVVVVVLNPFFTPFLFCEALCAAFYAEKCFTNTA